MEIDEKLREFATPRQWELYEAACLHGSCAKGAAALGIKSQANVADAIRIIRERAASNGYAPGHFSSGVATGYAMGKVTVHRDAAGAILQTWERLAPGDADRFAAIEAAFDAAAKELPRLAPVERFATGLTSLANLYTITDFHLGMSAWAREGGADWDLAIAERTMIAAFEHMITSSPRAGRAIINIQGDFLHTDGPEPVTPGHGHVLDASGRYAEMVDAAIRVLRRVVDVALMEHDEVEVVFAEGNHDPRGSMWLRKMFAALYEREPRLAVNNSELPFYVIKFGKVMLGIHHGHKVKNEQLPGIFAAQFYEAWGQTTKRYAHCGHRHHAEEKEYGGMTVVQHPTLAARDAYAARGGWISERAAQCITYHSEFGQVARTIVTPEMLRP
jgi:hypothetical protein